MALQNFSDYMKTVNDNTVNKQSKPSIKYFSLKDDGDSAYIILDVEKLDDLIIHSGHIVFIEAIKQNRFIDCLSADTNTDCCPLCVAGERNGKISPRIYRAIIPVCILKNGDINEVEYGVWNPSAHLISKLFTNNKVTSKLKEITDLRNVVFQLTRLGKDSNGYPTYDLQVVYTLPQNTIDFTPLNDIDIEIYAQSKTAEEMSAFINTGDFPGYGKSKNTISTDHTTQAESSFINAEVLTKPSYASNSVSEDEEESNKQTNDNIEESAVSAFNSPSGRRWTIR